jgi:hypothetical protein
VRQPFTIEILFYKMIMKSKISSSPGVEEFNLLPVLSRPGVR